MKLSNLFKGLIILALLSQVSNLNAQDTDTDTNNYRQNALKIFLDCWRCDDEYIRRELPYVNYVRDVREAEVYVLVTVQRSGNGGREYTFTFEGQKQFDGLNDTLQFTSMPDDTDDRVRSAQLHYLKMGLMRYVARTPMASELEITHNPELEEQEVVDRWNYWVFEFSVYPDFEAEETYRGLEMFSSAEAQRITEEWKFELDFDYIYDRVKYFYEDTSFTAIRQRRGLDALLVKSLTDHWSAGGGSGHRIVHLQQLSSSDCFHPCN